MHLQNDQLDYWNCQDIALTLLTRFKIWLVHNCQTEEDHLNIKIVTALLLYNACTLLNMMEMCVTNNNKLKIHPMEMETFKKVLLFHCFFISVCNFTVKSFLCFPCCLSTCLLTFLCLKLYCLTTVPFFFLSS